MARAERARWLMVAEAQSVRDVWEQTKTAIDKLAEKFDEDPEDAMTGALLISLSLITVHGFIERASNAARKTSPLIEDLKAARDAD